MRKKEVEVKEVVMERVLRRLTIGEDNKMMNREIDGRGGIK